MNLTDFLKLISDDHGPIQSVAGDVMENMSKEDFAGLCSDLSLYSVLTHAMRSNDAKALSISPAEFYQHFQP